MDKQGKEIKEGMHSSMEELKTEMNETIWKTNEER